MGGVWKTVLASALVCAVVLAPVGQASAVTSLPYADPIAPYADLPSQQRAAYGLDYIPRDVAIPSDAYVNPAHPQYAEAAARNRAWLDANAPGAPRPADMSSARRAAQTAGVPNGPAVTAPKWGAAAGRKLGGGFAIGWAITDGILAVYTATTGTNPLQGACADAVSLAVVSVLYQASKPDCTARFVDPNAGLAAGWSGSGYGLAIKGYQASRFSSAPANHYRVNLQTATENRSVMGRGSDGRWHSVGIATVAGGWEGPNRWQDGGEHFTSPGYAICLGSTETACNRSTAQIVTPKQSSGDPERELGCDFDYGAEDHVYLKSALLYRESAGLQLQSMNDCQLVYSNDDELPQSVKITSKNMETGAVETLEESRVPEYSDEEKEALRDDTGRGLVLWNGKKNCLNWEADCAGWWVETEKGATPGNYRCTFGASTVELLQCSIYRDTFNDREGAPVINDPVTDEPVEWEPDESNNGGAPGEKCFESGWQASNPIDWVLTPIKCGLSAMFIPKPAVIEQAWGDAMGEWDNTMPVQIIDVAQTTFTVPESVGCEGLRIHIPLSTVGIAGWVDIDWTVLNACDGPGATAAWWSRVIGSVVLLWVTALGVIRRVSSTVNAPGLG